MMRLRKVLYRIGFRPSGGSIWFSPSLALIYAGKDFVVVFKAAMEKKRKEMEDMATEPKIYPLMDPWAESTPISTGTNGGPRVGDPCCVVHCDKTLQKGEVYYYVTELGRDTNGNEQPVCWRHVRPDKGPITITEN